MKDSSQLGVTLGVVGGGQLGRMLAEAAAPIGVELIVLDPTPNAPAAATARAQIVAAFDDEDAVRELASRCDLLTYEIELAAPDRLATVAAESGTPVHPAPETLRMIQDKLTQKETLREAGIPVPAFRSVRSPDELRIACEEFGYPAMLKARRGGYDGRGNVPIPGPEAVPEAFDALGDVAAMVEEHVDFARELSVIGAKGAHGQRTFTPAENVHEAEILRETIVPARASDAVRTEAVRVAEDILALMTGRGVYGIELFETRSGDILVNEIAPRPHNSGHWTIEGAVTSQFEQHVRAVCGAPLGDTTCRGNIVTANLLGDVDETKPVRVEGVEALLAAGDVKLHWYGKREVRPLRKMGHLAVYESVAESHDDLLAAAREHVDAVTFRD